ncbi:unnamed protein product [Acanthoscelides obtectus]|uniref:Uncharacterized protein n=1 Tax=Acanthoscelides obtectus TaxID=200917 RepID=A0A9P0KEH9_ACAOB|nr:unnamed protein product [Acanthoscelides obtectus]CAK1679945.1 SCAN domain-containing protein 3 [Acanthoscelides obtectus]
MTDIVNCAQLIVYARYIGGDIIQEEILYSQSLTAGTTSEDGAPAMIGVRSGLAEKLKEKNSAMVSTYCVIQRQALASKTIATEIKPDFGLGYKDCKLHQEQHFEQSVILCILYFARISILITKFFCSIQKYADCPKATCWLAFMN